MGSKSILEERLLFAAFDFSSFSGIAANKLFTTSWFIGCSIVDVSVLKRLDMQVFECACTCACARVNVRT